MGQKRNTQAVRHDIAASINSSKSSEQLTLQGRQQAELRVEKLLEQLEPNGEMEGTILARYKPWTRVRDVPTEELAGLEKALAAEVRARRWLGDEKYFANLTGRDKLELYRRALALLEMVLDEGSVDADKPMAFADFSAMRDQCLVAASPWPDGTEIVLFYPEKKKKPPADKKPGRPRTQGKSGAFEKPDVAAVKVFCEENGLHHVDAAAFIDHYESNGWKVGGRAQMKDWKAAVRQWSRRAFGGTGRKLEQQGRPDNDARPDPLAATEYVSMKREEAHETA